MASRLKIRTDDNVVVISGKDKGKTGRVLEVDPKKERVFVEGLNIVKRHQRYEKIVRSSTTLHAHDENNDAGEGDTVRIVESRPLSKTKRWRLEEVLEKAK